MDNGYTDKHCGDCRHWHEQRGEGGVVDLGNRIGLCRLSPPAPAFVAVPQAPGKITVQQVGAAYPVIPSLGQACSQHETKLIEANGRCTTTGPLVTG